MTDRMPTDPVRAEIVKRVNEMSDGSAEYLLDGLRMWALGQGFPFFERGGFALEAEAADPRPQESDPV